jgi:two-component system sensor histidine kinase UhpB
MKETLKILLLEDDPNDAFIIESIIRQQGHLPDTTLVSSKKAFLDVIEKDAYDVIISDHHLPQFSSLEALRITKEKGIQTPFILVSGAVSDEYAASMLREGASDYILKDRLQRLPSAINNAIEQRKVQSQKSAAELALKKSNERFELATMASFDVIMDYDLVTGSFICNDALEKNFGYSPDDLDGPADLLKYVHPLDLPPLQKSFSDLLNGERIRWHRQFRAIREDKTVAYINSSALLLRDEDNKVYRIIAVLQDITEIVNLQNELAMEKIRRQKEIAETIIQAQEKERDEIGKELHDNVNQLLATAKIMIDSALRNPAMQEELLRFSQESILSAIQEIRNISHSMMPPSLENERFVDAITGIAQTVNISGALKMSLDLPSSSDLDMLNEKIKLTIYRIIQEQTTNILRHANADKASISIEIRDGLLLLTISDDGIGFDRIKRSKGIGLKNIEDRTEMLEGEMMINSSPGTGFHLHVQIPVVRKRETILTEEE